MDSRNLIGLAVSIAVVVVVALLWPGLSIMLHEGIDAIEKKSVVAQSPVVKLPDVEPGSEARTEASETLMLELEFRSDSQHDDSQLWSGFCDLVIRPFESGSEVQVVRSTILGGRSSTRLSRPSRVSLERAVVQDGELVLSTLDIEVTQSASATVHCGLRPVLEVRVIDLQTGKDLHGIRALIRAPQRREFPTHPGQGLPGDVSATAARSPLVVARPVASQTIWVTSAGYAWGRVVVARGTRYAQIELSRGVSLAATWDPGLTTPRQRVQISESGGSSRNPMMRLGVSGGSVEADGLPRGVFLVQLQREHGRGRWVSIAEATADLTVTPHVSVHLVPVEASSELGAVHGLVVFAEPLFSNETERMEVSMVPAEAGRRSVRLGREHLVAIDDYQWQWEKDGLKPGEYSVRLLPWCWEGTVMVTADEWTSVVADIEGLSHVFVRIENDAGVLLPAESLRVTRQVGTGGGAGMRFADSGRKDGVCEFRVMPGLYSISADVPGYGFFVSRHEFDPGIANVRISVRHRPTLTIRLHDGSAPLLKDTGWWSSVRIRQIDGPGGIESWSVKRRESRATAQCDFQLSDSGRYVVEFPPLLGYEPPADRMIELLDGNDGELDLLIKRDRQ